MKAVASYIFSQIILHRANILPVIFLMLSLGALSAVFIGQYIFGFKPCVLCIYQRVPYAVMLATSFLALLINLNDRWVRYLLVFLLIMSLSSLVLSVYHAGVEWHLWNPVTKCTNDWTAANSADDFFRSLSRPQAKACDEPEFVFLGLSIAGWNVLYSTMLIVFILAILRAIRKSKKTA